MTKLVVRNIFLIYFFKKHINCSLSQLNIKAGLEIYSCGGKNVLAFSLFQDILQNIKGTLNAFNKCLNS